MARTLFLDVETLGADVVAAAMCGEADAARILLDLGTSGSSDLAVVGVLAGRDALHVLSLDVFEPPYTRTLFAYSYAWLLAGGRPDNLSFEEAERLRADGSIHCVATECPEGPDEALDFEEAAAAFEAGRAEDPRGDALRALCARLSSGPAAGSASGRDFLLGAPAASAPSSGIQRGRTHEPARTGASP